MTTLNFQTLAEELQAFALMDEVQACEVYNVDYKGEAESYIRDWWEFQEREKANYLDNE